METYDANQLVHRHVVKFEAIETEDICIIKYGESEVTDGPRKGQHGTSGSFVSKRFKNKWYNLPGLLLGVVVGVMIGIFAWDLVVQEIATNLHATRNVADSVDSSLVF